MLADSGKTSSSFKLLSHPDRYLHDHLKDVGHNSKELASSLSIDEHLFGKGRLLDLSYLAGVCHDFGKATTWFQKYIPDPKRKHKTNKAYHAQISALFGYYVTSQIFKDSRLAYLVYYVIYYHHGDLADIPDSFSSLEIPSTVQVLKDQANDISVNSLGEVQRTYDELLDGYCSMNISTFLSPTTLNNLQEEIRHTKNSFMEEKSNSMDDYFRVLLLYSILLYTDKMNASGTDFKTVRDERKKWSEKIKREIVDNHKKTFTSTDGQHISGINLLRESAYREALKTISAVGIDNKRIFTIELPTGLGKTLTAIGTALALRERITETFHFTPRIIYSLPFLSIIDENFGVLTGVLSSLEGPEGIPTSLLLKHHHLSDIYYTFKGDNEVNGQSSDTDSYAVEDIGKRFLLMEGWNSEIIVTTFVQLFHSLITNRNASAMKFNNISGSVILLDEVQSIPHKYLKLIGEILSYMARNLNVWVILITATMPVLFDAGITTALIPDSDSYFSRMDRVHYSYDEKPLKLENVAEKVLAIKDRDVMVVVNTIGASQALYNIIKEHLTRDKGPPDVSEGYADFGEACVINLSSAVVPFQRMKRIELIEETSEKRKTVVTTQLIETGVNVDVDVIFRDIAPVDSIVQAGGRANRNGSRKKGEVRIVRIQDEKGNYYSRMIYDPVLLDITEEILGRAFNDGIAINETGMRSLVKLYCEEVSRKISDRDSHDQIEYLETLQFSGIRNKFKLIENDYPKMDVFVPIDKCAESTWNDYINIRQEKDPIERWKKMLSIRNRFYNYVVSVSKKITSETDEPVINAKERSINYDNEVGVKGVNPIW